ncbi:Protein CBG26364 [Caenorhabditis briggsae]|uniref:Protein CBG26364 n=1 Tax=Caenorhabditis briggsae TaxID=6238 RepID=B6IGD4_CAEBR|nr:Protein CBG26364 [Caenorhabditis briggsae]CAR98964.1 Protein CBG26364 [Caenorhabditis briggsae]
MKLFILLAIFGVSVLESSITGPPQIVRFTRHRGPFHSFGTKPPPVGESLVKVQHSEKRIGEKITIEKFQPTFYKHAKPFTINPWGPLSPYIHYIKKSLNLDVTKKPPRSGLTPKEEVRQETLD